MTKNNFIYLMNEFEKTSQENDQWVVTLENNGINLTDEFYRRNNDELFLKAMTMAMGTNYDNLDEPIAWFCYTNDFGKAGYKYDGKLIRTPGELYDYIIDSNETGGAAIGTK